MTNYLLLIIAALCGVCLLLFAHVIQYKSLAAHYKQTAADYQSTWEKAEEWVTILRKLTQIQEDRYNALLNVFAGYSDRLMVLHQHPKLHAKQLRRILNAHCRRQYNQDAEHDIARNKVLTELSTASLRRRWIMQKDKEGTPYVTRRAEHMLKARECAKQAHYLNHLLPSLP